MKLTRSAADHVKTAILSDSRAVVDNAGALLAPASRVRIRYHLFIETATVRSKKAMREWSAKP